MASHNLQKIILLFSTGILFLGLVFMFTTGTSMTGAAITDLPSPNPLVMFVVLGITIYTILGIMQTTKNNKEQVDDKE
jgi:hypothetical protein